MSTDTPTDADEAADEPTDEITLDEVTLTGEHARQFRHLMSLGPATADETPLTDEEMAERLLAGAVWQNYKQAMEQPRR